MTKKRAAILTLFLLLLLSVGDIHAAINKSAPAEISVSIGDYQFLLFGYTSPHSLVTLEGVGVFDQTYSNSKGYFEFQNRFSPFSTREPCLYSKDQLGRVSHTTCIPPFPLNRDTKIGPVLLPPTVYLNKSEYYTGDQIVLSGQTVPNTNVDLSFFLDQNRPSISFVKPAYAVSFPKLSAKTDSLGNFSISLPSSQADFFRVFVQDKYEKQDSPRSNTLVVRVLPWWMIIVRFFLLLWDIIRSRIFEFIILFQILLLAVYFLRKYLQPHAIVLYKKSQLMFTDHEIVLKKD